MSSPVPNIRPSAQLGYPAPPPPRPSVPVAGGPTPKPSGRESGLLGAAVIGVYVLGALAHALTTVIGFLSGGGNDILFSADTAVMVLAEVAVIGLVLVAALRRRAAVAIILAVAVVVRIPVWLFLAKSLFDYGLFGGYDMTWVYTWGLTVDFGVAIALVMAAWYLGRRRSPVPVVLAPVAGLMVALATWGTGRLLGHWHINYAGNSDMEFRTELAVRSASLTVANVIVVVALVVGFAWLGVALDRRAPAGPPPL
ncbi:hypothetical protein [Gordonia crocea]|uniref:Uncharacterized protein n=1 Tax=Gordonia crocea TaxID=589162 RepID=A0A7I9V1P4_9ACTN|nr:hypothetical protein [Gordonia crocea]GED98990.1 hypothetical protein nbrc107697_30290 [Gordonia crocea]GED99362.1 hypothetical protein nbrc107697_34010 [Gordonia crocea]